MPSKNLTRFEFIFFSQALFVPLHNTDNLPTISDVATIYCRSKTTNIVDSKIGRRTKKYFCLLINLTIFITYEQHQQSSFSTKLDSTNRAHTEKYEDHFADMKLYHLRSLGSVGINIFYSIELRNELK